MKYVTALPSPCSFQTTQRSLGKEPWWYVY